MAGYFHESKNWPNFRWDKTSLAELLANVRYTQGRLMGQMANLGFDLQQEATLQALTSEVLKSSAIEGENLDEASVRSSIARRLGIDIGGLVPESRDVEGIVEMMIDATQSYQFPLTDERLFGWHAALFPTGRSGMFRIGVGRWRDDAKGPMQIVSGKAGVEKVYFEAPPAGRLVADMTQFLDWFNQPEPADWVVNAAIAHLWFVTIHPFDDGNGRIARAIADMALARSEKNPKRFYSMSAQIRLERKQYYDNLGLVQRGQGDITPWMEWFFECLGRAIQSAENTLSVVLNKARFWESASKFTLNDRQKHVLNLLLDNFEGKLTTSKWAKLTKSSQDTASRDIQLLVDANLLVRNAEGGRSTSYSLVTPLTPKPKS